MIGKALRVVSRNSEIPASSQEERALIVSAQQGDHSAFKELYERYRDRVYGLIYYTLNREDSAEDVLQTVFIKVYRALPYFRLESCFHTWIYRVALNECKNRIRRKKLFIPLDDTTANLAPADSGTTPEIVHAAERAGWMVRQAVQELSPKLREVIVLKYLEELSYEEVATVLKCSSGTVASRLHRALAALENKLRPAFGGNEQGG